MADTLQFDLVSPEKSLVSRQVSEVRLPGAEGDMTALPGHAALITALRPGVLRMVSGDGADEYAVTGGFAEINAESVSVLAERSLHVSEVTQEVLDGFVEEARKAHERAQENGQIDLIDAAAKLLADMVAMGADIGLSPKHPSP